MRLMAMCFVLGATILGFGACGGDDEAAPLPIPDPPGASPSSPYKSGSRIKAEVLRSADGAQQFNGWVDTQLNEKCSFTAATDGKVRCLPGGGFSSSGYYANATCTTPLVVVPDGCAVSKYTLLSQQLPNTCIFSPKNLYAVHLTAGAYSGPTYRKSGTLCQASAVESGDVAYSLNPEIPASQFQEATTVVE